MAAALSAHTAGLRQVILVGEPDSGGLERMLSDRFLPFTTVLTLSPARQAQLADLLPFVAAMQPVDGRASAYVCRDFTCRPPATTVEALERELRQM
jgi:uncharacterized protein YyaL (SSP411 family)